MLLNKLQSIDYMYEPIPQLYTREKYFVYLDHSNQWQIVTPANTTIYFHNATETYQHILDMKLDLVVLEKYLDSMLLNKGVLAMKNLRKVLQFFDEEQIKKQEDHWNEFMGNMLKIVEEIPVTKTTLKIVE